MSVSQSLRSGLPASRIGLLPHPRPRTVSPPPLPPYLPASGLQLLAWTGYLGLPLPSRPRLDRLPQPPPHFSSPARPQQHHLHTATNYGLRGQLFPQRLSGPLGSDQRCSARELSPLYRMYQCSYPVRELPPNSLEAVFHELNEEHPQLSASTQLTAHLLFALLVGLGTFLRKQLPGEDRGHGGRK